MANQKIVTAERVNQGSAIVSVARADGDIIKTISTDTFSGHAKSTNYSDRGYEAKFDDYGLRRKTIELGDWNMDATASITVAHGLASDLWKNVRSMEVTVRNDADDTYYTDSTDTSANADAGIEIEKIDATNVTIKRAGSGTFDATTFNSTSYNRGWVTVWYE